jgi:thioredoxin 1
MKKVLMFSATWCGPCRQAKPVFNELKDSKPDVEFEVVDIDENHERAVQYNIAGVPTFIVLEEGVEAERLVGAANVSKLKEIL